MLVAGTGLKVFDFFRYFFNFHGILPRNETVNLFCFGIFSVRYNVSFPKIICISMPHQINVFFSHVA